MYKNIFSEKYEDAVSYGTAEDKIGEELADKIFGGIGPFFGSAVDGMEGALGNAADYAQHALNGFGSSAEQHIGNAYDSTRDFFDAQFASLSHWGRDAVNGDLREINFGERVNGLAHSSWNHVNHGFEKMYDGLNDGTAKINDLFKDIKKGN